MPNCGQEAERVKNATKGKGSRAASQAYIKAHRAALRGCPSGGCKKVKPTGVLLPRHSPRSC